MDRDDGLRDKLTKALPEALMPVGAGLRFHDQHPDAGELTAYGVIIVDALMPVVRAHSADVWDHGHRTANPVVPDTHRDVINPWKQPSRG